MVNKMQVSDESEINTELTSVVALQIGIRRERSVLILAITFFVIFKFYRRDR